MKSDGGIRQRNQAVKIDGEIEQKNWDKENGKRNCTEKSDSKIEWWNQIEKLCRGI